MAASSDGPPQSGPARLPTTWRQRCPWQPRCRRRRPYRGSSLWQHPVPAHLRGLRCVEAAPRDDGHSRVARRIRAVAPGHSTGAMTAAPPMTATSAIYEAPRCLRSTWATTDVAARTRVQRPPPNVAHRHEEQIRLRRGGTQAVGRSVPSGAAKGLPARDLLRPPQY